MVFSPEDIAWRSRRSGRYSEVAVFGVLRICCVGQRESCRLASATQAAKCPNPTYGNHYGHAEAVEVVYDPSLLSYRALLELFFQIHDPTRYEQQGSDFGPSYRSAIFYTDDAQKEGRAGDNLGYRSVRPLAMPLKPKRWSRIAIPRLTAV